jgi:hypothetical protein
VGSSLIQGVVGEVSWSGGGVPMRLMCGLEFEGVDTVASCQTPDLVVAWKNSCGANRTNSIECRC